MIPEFPLHKGNIEITSGGGKNQSVNVDFAVFCSNRELKRMFLVELKTDRNSIRSEQLHNMRKARCAKLEKILDGVIKAAKNSKKYHKYAHLHWKLHQLGCVDSNEDFEQIDMNKTHPGLTSLFNGLNVSENWAATAPELVLIAPRDALEGTKLDVSGFCVMTLGDVAQIIEDQCNPGLEFARYLRKWDGKEAGRVPLSVDPQN